MQNVLITGSKGRRGRILSKGLSEHYKLSLADLPENDIRNYKKLLKLTKGKNAIIHLAWKAKTENFQNGRIDADNFLMVYNIYRSAIKSKVSRVIIASSIHADNFRKPKKVPISPLEIPSPTSPYGADKIGIESLGKYYSSKGIEVICIRFGAVGYGIPRKGSEGSVVWLAPRDCVSLIESILDSKKVPNNFSIIYGVSNNKKRVHDISNPFGWKPKEGFGFKFNGLNSK